MSQNLHLVPKQNDNNKPNFTLIQLATHYSDYQLGITSEPLDDDKLSAIKFIRKLTRKAHKQKYRDYCLQDYAIPLDELPPNVIRVMQALNWISDHLCIPFSIKGFHAEYCNHSNSLPVGNALVKHYITFDKFVELLSILHKLDAEVIDHE